ncbi:hypothetical protein [Vulcanisaeta sp. JCM 16159]|uniref:hypothetical protein n=1 Tax=Vulcanisaeta sp. JCM 16159 TaxID=1295371 RepID=UPI0006D2744D|nr:hypothetical protein [Vulcanisaeta sp. JCM 16159]
MLSDCLIKALVEDLAQLPDAEKPRRLVALAGMEPKPLGRSMVEVIDGVKMSVQVNNSALSCLGLGVGTMEMQ